VQNLSVDALRKAEQLVVRRAHRTIVLSEFMAGELVDLARSERVRPTLIAGGVDTDWFSPGHGLRQEWAASASLLLFCARRLTTRTGVPELVRAMRSVASALPGVKLGLAGDGHQRGEVEALIRELDLGDQVKLLGRIDDESLRQWYRAADLVVTPTQELEGFGLATAEAMACGTPCLVTPVGANGELAALLDNRLVADGKTADHLSAAILHLAENRTLLDGLGRNARSLAVSTWSWQVVIDAHLELYREFSRGNS
jgi:glycosyltransferase involved in cell wall biosynthesis